MHETFKKEIVKGGNRIHALIESTLEAVQISEASPGWQEYINFTNEIIFNGFRISSFNSLKNMLASMIEEEVFKIEPFFVVKNFTKSINFTKIAIKDPVCVHRLGAHRVSTALQPATGREHAHEKSAGDFVRLYKYVHIARQLHASVGQKSRQLRSNGGQRRVDIRAGEQNKREHREDVHVLSRHIGLLQRVQFSLDSGHPRNVRGVSQGQCVPIERQTTSTSVQKLHEQ